MMFNYEKDDKQYILVNSYLYFDVDLPAQEFLDHDDKYIIAAPNKIVIKHGFIWDGPTRAIATKNSMRASCVHDVLYILIKSGVYPRSFRREADKIFMRICVEDGMNCCRARLWYWAVRLFGWRHV